VSFDELCGTEAPPRGGRTRIAVFHAVARLLNPPYFGVVTEGFPQLVRVSRTVIEPGEAANYPEQSPVVSRVRMLNEHPLIPDLEMLEHMVRDYAEDTSD
jgi:chemosensory pili system protein ChpC